MKYDTIEYCSNCDFPLNNNGELTLITCPTCRSIQRPCLLCSDINPTRNCSYCTFELTIKDYYQFGLTHSKAEILPELIKLKRLRNNTTSRANSKKWHIDIMSILSGYKDQNTKETFK